MVVVMHQQEIVAALFHREGYKLDVVDYEHLIAIADQVISPISNKASRDYSVELASGVNYFHSSYLSLVNSISLEKDIEPYRLILSLPKESHKFVTKEMCEKSSLKVSAKDNFIAERGLINSNQIHISSLDKLNIYLKEVSAKTDKTNVVSIALSSKLNEPYRISSTTSIDNSIVAHIEIINKGYIKKLIQSLQENVGYWVLESKLSGCLDSDSLGAPLFYYSEALLNDSVIFNEISLSEERVFVIDATSAVIPIEKSKFSSFGKFAKAVSHKPVKYIVDKALSQIKPELISQLDKGSTIILHNKMFIDDASWCLIKAKCITLVRLNYTVSLAYDIEKTINYYNSVYQQRGVKYINGIKVVSAGIVSEAGSIIVDDINSPSLILGETDGQGGVSEESLNKADLNAVSNAILNNQ